MTILAVDQSLTCSGIVIMNLNGIVIHYETFSTKKNPDLDILSDYKKRSAALLTRIQELASLYDVTQLVCEAPSLASNGNATRTLSWLFGAMLTTFPSISTVPPTTLKKFATGKGNASKDEVYLGVELVDINFFNKLSKIPKSKGKHDLADAFFLAHHKLQGLK